MVANETPDEKVFDVPAEFQKDAWISSMGQYEELYRRSLDDSDAFWAEEAEKRLHWFKKWDYVQNDNFAEAKVRWFEGGKLNVAYNCLDRHLTTWRKNKAAIVWQAEDRSEQTYTYQHLHSEVCKFANVLKKYGVKKGDVVTFPS